MLKYLVVVEKGETSWGAHVPDIPGCIAVGESREDVLRLIKGAIEMHIEALEEEGTPVPEPHFEGAVVEVTAA